MSKKIFLVDVNRCNGCHNCQIACKDEHCGTDWLPYAAEQPDTGQFWCQVKQEVHGSVPKVNMTYMPLIGAQTEEIREYAPEVLMEREDGLVVIDPERPWKKRLFRDCTLRELQKKVMDGGRRTEKSPSVREIAKYVRHQLNEEIWEEEQRRREAQAAQNPRPDNVPNDYTMSQPVQEEQEVPQLPDETLMLIWSIVLTVLCSIPGIVGLVKTIKARKAVSLVQKAKLLSSAKIWLIIGTAFYAMAFLGNLF